MVDSYFRNPPAIITGTGLHLKVSLWILFRRSPLLCFLLQLLLCLLNVLPLVPRNRKESVKLWIPTQRQTKGKIVRRNRERMLRHLNLYSRLLMLTTPTLDILLVQTQERVVGTVSWKKLEQSLTHRCGPAYPKVLLHWVRVCLSILLLQNQLVRLAGITPR